MRGQLIVVEGTDGSGKKTQTDLLIKRFKDDGRNVASFSFPQYGKKSAGPVEEYLNGRYGKPDEVSPYAASLLYALDRFDISREIHKALQGGSIVVLDRYVDSNVGHQGGKISDPIKRAEFIKWLYEIEYDILSVPKPDLVVILHVPAEVGQQLVAKKQKRGYIEKGVRDSHEGDLRHLKNAENSYLWLAQKYPDDHIVVECIDGDQLMSPEEIHRKVYKVVKSKLSH